MRSRLRGRNAAPEAAVIACEAIDDHSRRLLRGILADVVGPDITDQIMEPLRPADRPPLWVDFGQCLKNPFGGKLKADCRAVWPLPQLFEKLICVLGQRVFHSAYSVVMLNREARRP